MNDRKIKCAFILLTVNKITNKQTYFKLKMLLFTTSFSIKQTKLHAGNLKNSYKITLFNRKQPNRKTHKTLKFYYLKVYIHIIHVKYIALSLQHCRKQLKLRPNSWFKYLYRFLCICTK